MQKRNRKDRKRHQAEQEARQKVDDARLYADANVYLHAKACSTGCVCWCDACNATRIGRELRGEE